MSLRSFQIIVGVLIIAAGVLLYLLEIGQLQVWNDEIFIWATLFFVGSLILIARYFRSPKSTAWPLIGAGIGIGLSALLFIMAFTENGELASGSMFLIFGLGFLAVYLALKLRQIWPIIPGAIFLGLSALLFSLGFNFGGAFSPSIMFLIFTLGFLAMYFHLGGKQFWPFIPAGVFGGLSLLLLLAGFDCEGEVLAGSLFLMMGSGFAMIAIRHRRHTWALIPAGVLALLATFLFLLSEAATGAWLGGSILIISGIVISIRAVRANG